MAITVKHVTPSGAGSHNGTVGNEMTMAEMVTAINAGTEVGSWFKMSGSFSSGAASITISGSGSTTSPIVISGEDGCLSPRLPGGALDPTLKPAISINSTFQLNVTGASIIFAGLQISGSIAGNLVALGTNCPMNDCIVTNASTNAAAVGISGNANLVGNNDVSLGASGGNAAILVTTGFCFHNRVTSPNIGISCTSAQIVSNLVYRCGGDGISATSTTSQAIFADNTVVLCGGDGINLVTSFARACSFIENHITDNTGAAINFNTSTIQAFFQRNRFRDNVGGTIIGGSADWASAALGHITTDNGGPETDYVNPTGNNFALVAGAAGASGGSGQFSSIGAGGVPPGNRFFRNGCIQVR